MTSEEAIRADICEVGRRLYAQGYVASNDGNISVRLDDGRVMTTPTERVEGLHDARHDGRRPTIDGTQLSGDRNASSELKMHLAVYEVRPDVGVGGPRASADRDRIRRRRHPARSRGARRSDLHARLDPDRRVRDAVDHGAARRRRASTSRRTTGCCSPITARSPAAGRCSAPTTRWKPSSTSRRSAWWRVSSAASACSRAKRSARLQNLRDHVRHPVAGGHLHRPGRRARAGRRVSGGAGAGRRRRRASGVRPGAGRTSFSPSFPGSPPGSAAPKFG